MIRFSQLETKFVQNWSDLGKFDSIWAKSCISKNIRSPTALCPTVVITKRLNKTIKL